MASPRYFADPLVPVALLPLHFKGGREAVGVWAGGEGAVCALDGKQFSNPVGSGQVRGVTVHPAAIGWAAVRRCV